MLRSASRLCLLILLTTPGACAAPGLPAPQPGSTTSADAGITRTTLRDDARATVTRVHFAPGAAETDHTHPFDFMIVPTRGGAVTWTVNGQTVLRLDAGEVQFVPAGTPHLLANTGGAPFEVIAITFK